MAKRIQCGFVGMGGDGRVSVIEISAADGKAVRKFIVPDGEAKKLIACYGERVKCTSGKALLLLYSIPEIVGTSDIYRAAEVGRVHILASQPNRAPEKSEVEINDETTKTKLFHGNYSLPGTNDRGVGGVFR